MNAYTHFDFRYHTVSPKNLSKFFFLLLISQFIAKDALARPDIYFDAMLADINVINCQSCHASEPGGEGKESLKPGYEAAYNLDINELSRLKNLINGCPSGQTLNRTTFLCATSGPVPVVCVLPQVRDPATNTCITPPCPIGQVRNSGGVCEGPPTTPGCDKTRQNTADLEISDPGYIFTHAGRVTRAGVTVYGDNRRVEMAVSDLPKGARFYETYNPSLRSVEGVVVWQVPVAMAGQKLEFNLCGTSKGGGKPDGYVNRTITIEVLPLLANVTAPDPAVSSNYLISSVYNHLTGKLDVSGQVIWFWMATEAARQTAILQPVELFDAETGSQLGSGEVGLNGRWSISLPVARNNLPKAVDALFLGRLGTKPVQNYDSSDEDN